MAKTLVNNKSFLKKLIAVLDVVNKHSWLMAVIVITFGFLLATILLVITGRNPAGMYGAMLQSISGFNVFNGSFNARHIGEWLAISTPLILCGLSVAFALKAGLFNIGAEGQYIMGVTFAQWAAFFLPQLPFVHAVMVLIAATLAGALYGGLVGFLKGKYGVSEVVATIMLNHIAFFFTRWFTIRFIPDTSSFATPPLPESARLTADWLRTLTNNSMLNYGFFVMLLALVVYHMTINKTTLGLSLRASGFNPKAASFSGISTIKASFISMAIAGGFAGLAGGVVAMGSFPSGRVMSAMDMYGFNGIAVALVAAGNALGIFFSGLLFGMLTASQSLMTLRQIPREITVIINGLVVVFISLTFGLKLLASRLKINLESHPDNTEAS
ncbi:MAG: ABC transporter permease [Spirochaetaceae bacterium]|nr:ABC transporter permease [Spirochaetaceae bacterium]